MECVRKKNRKNSTYSFYLLSETFLSELEILSGYINNVYNLNNIYSLDNIQKRLLDCVSDELIPTLHPLSHRRSLSLHYRYFHGKILLRATSFNSTSAMDTMSNHPRSCWILLVRRKFHQIDFPQEPRLSGSASPECWPPNAAARPVGAAEEESR